MDTKEFNIFVCLHKIYKLYWSCFPKCLLTLGKPNIWLLWIESSFFLGGGSPKVLFVLFFFFWASHKEYIYLIYFNPSNGPRLRKKIIIKDSVYFHIEWFFSLDHFPLRSLASCLHSLLCLGPHQVDSDDFTQSSPLSITADAGSKIWLSSSSICILFNVSQLFHLLFSERMVIMVYTVKIML